MPSVPLMLDANSPNGGGPSPVVFTVSRSAQANLPSAQFAYLAPPNSDIAMPVSDIVMPVGRRFVA